MKDWLIWSKRSAGFYRKRWEGIELTKTTKKTVKVCAGLLVVLLVLSTCMVMAAAKKPVELTYWYPNGLSNEQAVLKQAIDLFNRQNPDIVVKGEFAGTSGSGQGTTDKLMVAISGGNPPDVVTFDRFMVGQWADQGLFENVSALARAAKINKNQFYDFAWQEASYKGNLYGLPFDTDTRALFYNKKMFREAGLDPNKPPLSIKQLDEYAAKLTKKEGNRYRVIGFIPWLQQGWLYTWGWSFGGQFQDKKTGKITANDPGIVKALEWETTYAKKYDIEAVTNFATAAGGDINPFAAGMVAMVISGPWELSGFKVNAPNLDYGISYIPTPSGTKFNSWAGGWANVIPKGVKNKEAAFRFARFMSLGEGARLYGEGTTHFMAARALNDKFTWFKEDPRYQIFVSLLPKSFCRPVIPKGQLLWDELVNATDSALNGKGTPKDLLDKATAKVNKELGY